MSTLADFECINLKGELVSLKQYLGKVVLVVNTASACRFTHQYQGLQALYTQYQAQGLVILAFPCNQFGAQESGDAGQIAAFCDTQFSITFPIMQKVDVNGVNAVLLYQWLQQSQAGIFGTQRLKWNFTKFLISKEGTVFKRYGSMTQPNRIAKDIKLLLI